ncbi:SpoIID/LytB domain-containing protein [Candidatus Poriferisodalis sp.]|uniref:SpoIID/LytB domain-containing protein n=1 Tax=Candidatus Poriferisodalis sp. TaxID=3101277 RepID=UPI003B01F59A
MQELPDRLRRAVAVAVACAVACAVAAGSLAFAASPAGAQQAELAPSVIIVEGRGFGHGNGLSQWGALGYAVDHRWTSDQIVQHYYGNTVRLDVSDPDIWVHLARNDRNDLLVTSASAFAVAGHQFDGGEVVRIGVSSGSFWVRSNSGCGRRGDLVSDGLEASSRRGDRYVEAVPSADDYSVDDQSQFLVMILCDGLDTAVESSRIAYRGSLGVLDQNGPYSFNRVPLEQYLRGVVPRESRPAWGALGDGRGIAALEAQAIAARSYVLSLAASREKLGRFTDTCDNARCQVYDGAARDGQALDHGIQYIHTNTAILSTAGHIRVHDDGSIAFTEFHASSGGWTVGLDEGSRFPGVQDLGDSTVGNSNHAWEFRISRSDIEAAYPSIGSLVCIEVTHRNGNGAWGGRTRGMRIVGTDGVEDFEGHSGVVGGQWNRWARDPFRKQFSLRSDWYRFPQFPDGQPCERPASVIGDPSTVTARPGLWVLKSDGTVIADGAAEHLGDGTLPSTSDRFAAMAAHPDGDGYWLATSGGDVQSFGSAAYHGNAVGAGGPGSVVAMAAHPDGDGYWLATGQGDVFAFGKAGHWGAIAHLRLAAEVVDIESSPTGDGYWLALDDGRVLAFGDARDLGCGPLLRTGTAGIGLAVGPDGGGYWIAGADTAVHAIGAADHLGDRASRQNRLRTVAIAATATGDGYWLVWSDGTSFNYGDAPDYRTSRAGPGVVAASSVR